MLSFVGNAPLPAGNVLPPEVRAQLSVMSIALQNVLLSNTVNPLDLNTLLEVSRDMELSYNLN